MYKHFSSPLRPRRNLTCRYLVLFAIVLELCPTATAQVFMRIADTSTPIPNGSGNFQFLGGSAVSGSTVVFHGAGAIGQGIYAGTTVGGPLFRVVDTNTPIPNGTGNFHEFATGDPIPLSLSGSTVVFRGLQRDADRTITQSGVYAASTVNGSLARVADRNTPTPNGLGNGFGAASVSGSTVAFQTFANYPTGIYLGSTSGGTLIPVADGSTPIPNGAGNFDSLNSAAISGSTVVFEGYNSSERGIYSGTTGGGPLTQVVDMTTPIPNGIGNFLFFGHASVFGSTVAFSGSGSAQAGIYTAITGGGSLSRVADLNTSIPGGAGNFTGFGFGVVTSVSGSTVAFSGNGSGGQYGGIYTASTVGESLSKVIVKGDTLDGRTVTGLSIGKNGLDGTLLAFDVGFADGSSGVYVAFLPGPGDYNRNGVVEAGDYVVWRQGLGTTYTQNDFNVWRAHYGQTAGSGSAASANVAIPEPAALSLLLVGAVALLCQRRTAVGDRAALMQRLIG